MDLLFTDLLMPGGMNGLELAVAARRGRPQLKVLLTSGNMRQPGRAPPPDVPMLRKPYDHEQLRRAVNQALA